MSPVTTFPHDPLSEATRDAMHSLRIEYGQRFQAYRGLLERCDEGVATEAEVDNFYHIEGLVQEVAMSQQAMYAAKRNLRLAALNLEVAKQEAQTDGMLVFALGKETRVVHVMDSVKDNSEVAAEAELTETEGRPVRARDTAEVDSVVKESIDTIVEYALEGSMSLEALKQKFLERLERAEASQTS